MFRKITIVRLVENNSLLNFDLAWPAKVNKQHSLTSNISLLRYADIIKGSLARQVMMQDKSRGYKTVVVPIQYCPMSGSLEWVADITDIQYEHLTNTIQSLFSDMQVSHSKQCWYSKKDYVSYDLGEQYPAENVSITKELTELEMMLYAHQVNQSRVKYRQSKISGVMLGHIGQKGWHKPKCIVGNSDLVSLLYKQRSLQKWLEKPNTGCTIVCGKEVGDQELYRIKETVLHLMETSKCDFVEVIQQNSHTVYSASWFYNMYSQAKSYLFSKQAM